MCIVIPCVLGAEIIAQVYFFHSLQCICRKNLFIRLGSKYCNVEGVDGLLRNCWHCHRTTFSKVTA